MKESKWESNVGVVGWNNNTSSAFLEENKKTTLEQERERDAQAQQLITSVSTRSLTDAASAARTGR
jgi:hypothetical protein